MEPGNPPVTVGPVFSWTRWPVLTQARAWVAWGSRARRRVTAIHRQFGPGCPLGTNRVRSLVWKVSPWLRGFQRRGGEGRERCPGPTESREKGEELHGRVYLGASPSREDTPKPQLIQFPGSLGTFAPGKWARFLCSLTASSISVP